MTHQGSQPDDFAGLTPNVKRKIGVAVGSLEIEKAAITEDKTIKK